ncbi:hypothetical protein MC885_014876 [Smutsia gigantea]|nr:hypothetical protein MC885_014876 [Smutsia gigantea]
MCNHTKIQELRIKKTQPTNKQNLSKKILLLNLSSPLSVPVLCGVACLTSFCMTPYKSQADSTAEKTADNVSSSTPLCVITNRPPPSTANGVTAATVLSSPGTDSSVEARERRRAIGLTSPLCDGEPEAQRRTFCFISLLGAHPPPEAAVFSAISSLWKHFDSFWESMEEA